MARIEGTNALHTQDRGESTVDWLITLYFEERSTAIACYAMHDIFISSLLHILAFVLGKPCILTNLHIDITTAERYPSQGYHEYRTCRSQALLSTP
jgi:hypothetical protein